MPGPRSLMRMISRSGTLPARRNCALPRSLAGEYHVQFRLNVDRNQHSSHARKFPHYNIQKIALRLEDREAVRDTSIRRPGLFYSVHTVLDPHVADVVAAA